MNKMGLNLWRENVGSGKNERIEVEGIYIGKRKRGRWWAESVTKLTVTVTVTVGTVRVQGSYKS